MRKHKSDPITRFWKYLIVGKEDECWEWQAYKDKNGYGKFWDGKIQVGAHRYSWMLHNGSIPKGMFICHHCDNPPCCNPKHLFLGTHLDNMRDMHKKYYGY